MATQPEQPRDEPEVEYRFGQPVIKQKPTSEEKPAVEKEVDDQSPLSLDELVDVGKEAFSRVREVPLKGLRRGVRTALDSWFGSVEGAVESVEKKGLGKKDKSK